MPRIDPIYRMETTPVAHPEAIVQGDTYRFTVLSSSLIRMEYAADGIFEDRATQLVVNRRFDVPHFTVAPYQKGVRIRTDAIELNYSGGAFSRDSLSAYFLTGFTGSWCYGDQGNTLPGTARTLDEADGECTLEPSFLSQTGMCVVDDSKTLIIAEDGWLDERKPDALDMYLFCHRRDYGQALKEYCQLTGSTPLLPRFVFGNWWSRYYAYMQDEYTCLMDRFHDEGIPFSVAVIDMDWHYVTNVPYHSGWTGFSWNKELFPDHQALLKRLHADGKHVTLNLHPADGVAPHEDCYQAFARRCGVDPATKQTIPCNVTDPKWLEDYFDTILHPMEQEGIDFWWMDWQQGTSTSIKGLDPLWVLNHYHYLDSCRNGKRGLCFSRYAGLGSHRYPIGFSGDTVSTWESLQFQPYFTACASNAFYTWWSHDIGGHMHGVYDEEMATRWVQYGVFSPIMRLHSTNNEFMSKEPWNYGKEVQQIMVKFLRLRHQMIPYLYTMNELTHREAQPLITPMYYDKRCYRMSEQDGLNRNQYFFGTEMMVSPIVHPTDPASRMASVQTFIPEGIWFDFFTGLPYVGKRICTNYRTLEQIPVFVKAGGIIPLDDDDIRDQTNNPTHMRLEVFPCADGQFTLYEDDGCSLAYQDGHFARTTFLYHWDSEAVLTLEAPQGDTSVIPTGRTYTVAFRETMADDVIVEGPDSYTVSMGEHTLLVTVTADVNPITIRLRGAKYIPYNYIEAVRLILSRAQCANDYKHDVYHFLKKTTNVADILLTLDELQTKMNVDPCVRHAIEEIILQADFGNHCLQERNER